MYNTNPPFRAPKRCEHITSLRYKSKKEVQYQKAHRHSLIKKHSIVLQRQNSCIALTASITSNKRALKQLNKKICNKNQKTKCYIKQRTTFKMLKNLRLFNFICKVRYAIKY